jgi:hypothetical protein
MYQYVVILWDAVDSLFRQYGIVVLTTITCKFMQVRTKDGVTRIIVFKNETFVLLLSVASGTYSIFDCNYCIRTNGLYFNIMR